MAALIDPTTWRSFLPGLWVMSLLMSWVIEYRAGNETEVANEAKRAECEEKGVGGCDAKG